MHKPERFEPFADDKQVDRVHVLSSEQYKNYITILKKSLSPPWAALSQ